MPEETDPRTEQFSMKISKGLRHALNAEAGRQKVTVSTLVFQILIKRFKSDGGDTPTAERADLKSSGCGFESRAPHQPSIDDSLDDRRARAKAALAGSTAISHEDAPPPESPYIQICGHNLKDMATGRGCGCKLIQDYWLDKRKPGGRTIAFCEECGSMG